jgi:hypothetical protein
MKPILDFLNRFFYPRRLPNYVVLVIIMISQSSCFKQYYQTNSTKKIDAPTLQQLRDGGKFFIIHTPVSAFGLTNVKVNSKTISGNKQHLGKEFDSYLNPVSDIANPMARRDKRMTLNEVHLYTQSNIEGNDQVDLAISQIDKMDIYSRDEAAIKRSRVESIVGITLGVGAIIGLGAIVATSTFTFHY